MRVVFHGTVKWLWSPGCPAMTFSESSHENWTLIWYNLHRPQQLGDVDILLGKAPCLRDPLPALSPGGYGEMVVERDEERSEEEKGRKDGRSPFIPQTHVSSQNARPLCWSLCPSLLDRRHCIFYMYTIPDTCMVLDLCSVALISSRLPGTRCLRLKVCTLGPQGHVPHLM